MPHARILELDVSAARALPGVFAVLTQEDVPQVRHGPFVRDRTLFARDVVRFEGEVVAAVAALTPEAAAEACRLIRVRYEPIEPMAAAEHAWDGELALISSRLNSSGYVYWRETGRAHSVLFSLDVIEQIELQVLGGYLRYLAADLRWAAFCLVRSPRASRAHAWCG